MGIDNKQKLMFIVISITIRRVLFNFIDFLSTGLTSVSAKLFCDLTPKNTAKPLDFL
jgi:hypothetical protein